MFAVQTRTVIRQSPEVVFAFVADQTNAPRWQRGLAEVRRVTPGPIRVGSEHLFVRRFAGRRLATVNRFTRYEPPVFVEFEVPDGWLVGRASYLVEPHPAGTLLISSMNFQVLGPRRVLEPVLQRVLAHDTRRDDHHLAGLLATTAPRRCDASAAPGRPARP